MDEQLGRYLADAWSIDRQEINYNCRCPGIPSPRAWVRVLRFQISEKTRGVFTRHFQDLLGSRIAGQIQALSITSQSFKRLNHHLCT